MLSFVIPLPESTIIDASEESYVRPSIVSDRCPRRCASITDKLFLRDDAGKAYATNIIISLQCERGPQFTNADYPCPRI